LLSSVSDMLTFITLRLGFHASATLFAAVGSSNRPSPNSPSRSSRAPAGPSATRGKDRARTRQSERGRRSWRAGLVPLEAPSARTGRHRLSGM